MRPHAVTAEKHKPEQGQAANGKSRKRSSPAANAMALGCAAGLLAVHLWFRGAALIHSGNHLYVALAMTAIFALAARMTHGVSTSGAVAGAMIAFVFASRDLRLFWLLLIVFLVTLAATRTGALRKHEINMAERDSGRSASQVMANVGIAALALAAPSFQSSYLLAVAALAELAADTTSSEIGTAFSTRIALITTGKPVSAGTDGGISLKGTMAGVAAALITAACAIALGLVSFRAAAAVVCAGVVGMFVDSLLGATLEQRGYLNNDLVNLVSTGVAGSLAISLSLLAFGP